MKIAFSIPGYPNIDTGNPPGLRLTPLPSGVPTGGLTTGQNAIQAFLNLTLAIAILTCLWFIVKGGLDISTSRGDKEKVKSGRERVIYAVLGLIFIFLSFFIISVIGALFGINLLSFSILK